MPLNSAPTCTPGLRSSVGGSAGDEDLVLRYVECLNELPAIEINQHHEIIDGWYRWEAHRQAGRSTIRARVTEVQDDLEHLKLAIRRNATHGLPYPIDVWRRLREETRLEKALERTLDIEVDIRPPQSGSAPVV
jgi:hypothetical protein